MIGRLILPSLMLFFPYSLLYADATLFLSPPEATHAKGEIFTVQVLVDSPVSPISSAEAELTFDAQALVVEEVSIEGSILATWATTPVFSNEQPKIRFAGWTRQNFIGTNGLLMSIRFRALENGVSDVSIQSAAILAANELATNVITSMKGGTYRVAPNIEPVPAIILTAEAPQDFSDFEPEVLGATSVLPPPEFTEYAGSIMVGDSIRVRGIAVPNAVIAVHVSGGDNDAEVVSQVTAFDDGVFTFASPPITDSGVYRLWAEALEGEQNTSEPSKRITITARAAGFTLFSLRSALYLVALTGILIFGILIGVRVRRRDTPISV